MDDHVRETSVGAFEAKTNLNKLLKDVESGKAVYKITRRGKPVAMLMPVGETERERSERVGAFLAMVRERRKKYHVTADEIVAWRDEGRKW
jgi:prevent-host-death family protein